MSLTLVLVAVAALAFGVLLTWLLMKNQIQSQTSDLSAKLAEQSARCGFAEKAQSESLAELGALNDKYASLQAENYALGNRCSVAEKQIVYLEEKNSEAAQLKQSYDRLQEKAQALAVENESLATRIDQQNKAFDEKYRLLEAASLKKDKDLEEHSRHIRDLQSELYDLGNRHAAAEKQIVHAQERAAEAEQLKQLYDALQEKAQTLEVDNERLETQVRQENKAFEEKSRLAEQIQTKTRADLEASRKTAEELQNKLYDLGNRHAAAEKQIAHLRERAAEAEQLKQLYDALQEKAQTLEVDNERLETQVRQENKAFEEKSRLAEQIQTKTRADLEASRKTAEELQNKLYDLGNRHAAAEKQIAHLRERATEAEQLKQLYDALQEKAQALEVGNERLATQIEQERLAADEKLAVLDSAKASLNDQFQNLANQILEEKSRRFTEQNRVQLTQVLTPLNERINGFSELVKQTYDKESRERLTLENELKRLQGLNTQLHNEAKALTNALTGTQNKVQGNWGEMILETVLENSGLQKGREYIIQAASTRKEEDGSIRRLQPDVLVNLPDNKQIVIDSKVSLTAYVRYTQAENAEDAARELAAHVASIRTHMKGLSLKNYTDLEGVNTLDFVFMFVPVEPAYLLALQHDAGLFQECFDKRIMLVGPSTLLATLRTVANIWRNEQQNQNALIIAEEGGKLYDKFVGFVQTVEKIGKSIEQAQGHYQTAYKQLVDGSGNLVNRAEKLRLLGVKTSKQLSRDVTERAGSPTDFALNAPQQNHGTPEASES